MKETSCFALARILKGSRRLLFFLADPPPYPHDVACDGFENARNRGNIGRHVLPCGTAFGGRRALVRPGGRSGIRRGPRAMKTVHKQDPHVFHAPLLCPKRSEEQRNEK